MNIELGPEFVRSSGVELGWQDLRVGWERGIISPATVVELATDAVAAGAGDPGLMALALLVRPQPEEVAAVLTGGEPSQASSRPQSERTWLFLQLSALWAIKDEVADPLALVEELYVDYGYPERMAGVVRYMPVQAGLARGHEAVMGRWGAFLDEEARALRSR